MVVLKTVLKVDIYCDKCKQKLLGIVSGLEGLNKIEVDAEKGTLTAVGEADPYDIIMAIKKSGKHAAIITIGPPPKPDEKPKEPEKKNPCACPGVAVCHGCVVCRPVAVIYDYQYQDPLQQCSIM